VQHSFTGAIKLESDNKTFYREKSPGPQYVGKPSAEIDANWNNLLRGKKASDLFVKAYCEW
jgi:hypothetical protein